MADHNACGDFPQVAEFILNVARFVKEFTEPEPETEESEEV